MERLSHKQKSPIEVEIYFGTIKIIIISNGSVIFTPQSADVLNNWKPENVKILVDYTAPLIAKMLKR
jgi:hypothetical protein